MWTNFLQGWGLSGPVAAGLRALLPPGPRVSKPQAFANKLAADHDDHVFLHPTDYSADDLVAVFQRHATYLKNSRLYHKSATHFAALLKVIWQAVVMRELNTLTTMPLVSR